MISDRYCIRIRGYPIIPKLTALLRFLLCLRESGAAFPDPRPLVRVAIEGRGLRAQGMGSLNGTLLLRRTSQRKTPTPELVRGFWLWPHFKEGVLALGVQNPKPNLSLNPKTPNPEPCLGALRAYSKMVWVFWLGLPLNSKP